MKKQLIVKNFAFNKNVRIYYYRYALSTAYHAVWVCLILRLDDYKITYHEIPWIMRIL